MKLLIKCYYCGKAACLGDGFHMKSNLQFDIETFSNRFFLKKAVKKLQKFSKNFWSLQGSLPNGQKWFSGLFTLWEEEE